MSLVLQSNRSFAQQDSKKINRAIFRLSGVVFFTQDVRDSIKSFAVMKCLGSGSSKSFIEVFSSSSFSEFLKSRNQVSFLSDDKLLSLIKIEKLKVAALGLSKDSLSKKELSSLSKKCGRLNWSKLADDEKSLLIGEVFLRDRFAQEKDVYNRLSEYARSLSIQESHEVYSNSPSKHLAAKYRQAKAELSKVKEHSSVNSIKPVNINLMKNK